MVRVHCYTIRQTLIYQALFSNDTYGRYSVTRKSIEQCTLILLIDITQNHPYKCYSFNCYVDKCINSNFESLIFLILIFIP